VGLQLRRQGADLLIGNAIENRFHASQAACGGFQHVEDLFLWMSSTRRGWLAWPYSRSNPTVELGTYRLLQGGNALVQLRSVLGSISVLRGSLYRDFCALLLLHGQVLNSVVKDLPQCL
jgi:hypothetical protein